MITAEHLEAWRGQSVIDPSDEQLGKLEEVYLDTRNEQPVLIEVKSGLLGRRRHLIPVNDARVGPDYVRVVHDRDTVERAGSDTGSDEGAPSAMALVALGDAYGLRFADQLQLEGAREVEKRRAAAREARERAEELEGTARERETAQEAAQERAEGAGEDAGRAEREAHAARRAADDARAEAERHGGAGDPGSPGRTGT